MIVGFDVCHDPRDKRKSYGAMVATTDDSLARYFSIVKHHAAGDELSVNFGLSLECKFEKRVHIENLFQTYSRLTSGY